jgi:hypothetical protein
MVYSKASTILTMLLLAIVATTCLASYDASWQRASNSLRRRVYNNQGMRRTYMKQRAVDCPAPYRYFGGNDCVCSYTIDFSHQDGIIYGPATDNFNSVDDSGNCGDTCPDGLTFVATSYIDGPFTFTYSEGSGVLAGRVCKTGGK